MTVAWITNPGGIYTRLGKLYRATNDINAFRGTTTDDDVTTINTQFPSPTTNQQIAINDLYQQRNNSRNLTVSWFSQLNQFAINTIIEQVNDDTVLPQKNLTNALLELISQMVDNSESIQRPTLGSTVTASGDNDGDAVLYSSLVGPDGTQQDYLLAETLKLVCTQDGSTGTGGGGTQYAETFSYTGDPTRAPTEYNWPGGSGVQGQISVTDAATTTANVVQNGAFTTWASALAPPENWLYAVGTAGTAFVRASSANAMRSEDYAMQMTSDGSTVLKLRQVVTLVPDTVYAVNLWAKTDAAAAGQVAIRLVDATGTVITDNAGTSNTIPLNTNSLTTSYQPLEDVLASGTPFFRTPRSLPSTVYLEIAMTTPPVNGTDVFIDLVALVAATRLYVNGPFIAMFSGEAASVRLDYYQDVFTNSRTSCQFVFCMDRAYGLQALGLKIPSSNSPTIPDALINNTLCTTTTTSTTTTTTTT